MEDDCAECIANGTTTARTSISGPGPPEQAASLRGSAHPGGPVPLEINPPPDRPVDLRPLYDPATDRAGPGPRLNELTWRSGGRRRPPDGPPDPPV